MTHRGTVWHTTGMAQTREDAEARLIDEIETGRVDEIGYFLLEFLAEWGPDNLDVGRLARRVFERIEEDE